MPHFIQLHLTTLDERSKAGRKREPATGSEHLLVGIKITIPVYRLRAYKLAKTLVYKPLYTSEDARSCVNDDCFDFQTLTNRKFQWEKKSDLGDFASTPAKMAALYKKKLIKQWPMLRLGDKGVYFRPIW